MSYKIYNVVSVIQPISYNIGEDLFICDNMSGHCFQIGDKVRIFRIYLSGMYDVCNMPTGDCDLVLFRELTKTTDMQLMKNAVLLSANKLLKANNTVTTLEIKTDLIACQPQYYWKQTYVSDTMDEFAGAGKFTYVDTATGPNQHRIYSDPNGQVLKAAPTAIVGTFTKRRGRPRKTTTPALTSGVATKQPTKRFKKNTKLTPSQALTMMANNKGHFFTATFIKKDGTRRTINCQYLKDQTQSTYGHVKVRETGKLKTGENAFRQINLNTLEELRIAGKTYLLK